MRKLLQIESIKTLNNPGFRIILALHFLLFLLVVYVFTRIDITAPGFSTKNMFMFPHVWEIYAWIASWFNLLFLGLIIILLTGNEFNYKTVRMQIINGLSRNEFLSGKLLIIFFIAIWAALIVFLSGIITGLIFTKDISMQLILDKSYMILIYFFQAIAYMSFALMIAVIFKSNALAIIMYLLYFIMIEPIARLFFPKEVRPYFPVKVISDLTPVPEFLSITSNSTEVSGNNVLDFESIGLFQKALPLHLSLIMGVFYTILFIAISYWIIKKRDF